MYKLVTLLFAGSIVTTVSQAQLRQQPGSFDQIVRMAKSMNAVHNSPVSKTTAVKQRLTGYMMRSSTGPVVDSTIYFYDFGRGSEFDFDDMTYYDFPLYPNVYDEKIVRFDSASKPKGPARSYTMKYAGNKQVNYMGHTVMNIDSIDWHYDAQDRLTSLTSHQYDKGVAAKWDPAMRYFYEYDAAGRVIKDSSERYMGTSWALWQAKTLHYNSAGLVDTITCMTSGAAPPPGTCRYIFGYTGTLMTAILLQDHNGTNWEDYEKKTIAYTGNQKISEITEEWNGSSWDLQGQEFRHLDANGLPDSIYLGTKGNPIFARAQDTSIRKVVYNSFGNPVTIDHYDLGMVARGQQRYWYQEYDPTAVKDVTTTKALNVYPNPAHEQLTVSIGDLPKGKLQYHIINSMGQVVIKQSADARGVLTIDISALATGTYWLQLQDAKSEWYQAGFSKVE